MNSAEFINYIVTPLSNEQMHLLYKANNVKYEKCNLYFDFILSLNKLIVETYLGDDFINSDEDIYNHFAWCIEKNVSNFKEENIVFNNIEKLKEYFYYFYYELFYKTEEKINVEERLNNLAILSFDYHRLKSRSDMDVLIELYKIFEKSLQKSLKM